MAVEGAPEPRGMSEYMAFGLMVAGFVLVKMLKSWMRTTFVQPGYDAMDAAAAANVQGDATDSTAGSAPSGASPSPVQPTMNKNLFCLHLSRRAEHGSESCIRWQDSSR